MKSFHSNNFSFYIYPNSSELFLGLLEKVKKFISSNPRLLKDRITILLKESSLSHHISRKLARNKIPSLYFETTLFRKFLNETAIFDDGEILSKEAAVFILENCIAKKRPNLKEVVIRKNAKEIYSEYSKFTGELKSFPEHNEGFEFINEFRKIKKNKKLFFEILRDNFNKDIKNKNENKIIFFAVNQITNLEFEFIKKIFNNKEIEFHLLSPIVSDAVEFSLEEKIKDILPINHVLVHFFPDLKLEEISFHVPKIQALFYNAPESYREVEYAGQRILKLIEEKKHDKEFRLTNCKIIIPNNPAYSSAVDTVFTRMGIPFSFSGEFFETQTPFLAAVLSLLRLAHSNFELNFALSLFHNPCFYPNLGSGRVRPDSAIWNRILVYLGVKSFLDSEHKKKKGRRETLFLTWENAWKRTSLWVLGQTEDAPFEEGEKEEAMQMVQITSSLFYDLISFQENEYSLGELCRFFRVMVDVYLHTEIMGEESNNSLSTRNERDRKGFLDVLTTLEETEIELKELGLSSITQDFSISKFVEICEEIIDSNSTNNPQILRDGVVVTGSGSVAGAEFEEIFVLGMDEGNWKIDSLLESESIHLIQKDFRFRLDTLLRETTSRIHFFYQSLDTIKDRVKHPHQEYLRLKNLYNSNLNKISLFPFQGNIESESILFDSYSSRLNFLKRKEAEYPEIVNSLPEWESGSSSEFQIAVRELSAQIKIEQNLESYYLRKRSLPVENLRNQSHFDLRQFSAYLECPKKFFYTNVLSLEEEAEDAEETYSIHPFLRSRFLKEVLVKCIENENLTTTEILNIIFSRKNQEFGKIPSGILGEVEKEKWTEKLDLILTYLKSEILNNYKIIQNIKFRINPERDALPAPKLFDKYFEFDIPFLFYKEGKGYIVQFQSSNSTKSISMLIRKSMLPTIQALWAVAGGGVESIQNKYNLSKLTLNPAILNLSDKSWFESGFIESYSLDIFRDYFDSFLKGEFPASPLEKGEDNQICSFCNLKNVCFGYQVKFENWPEEKNDLVPFFEKIIKKKSSNEKS